MKLSLVIPTYNEKENIQKLLSNLKEYFDQNKIENEIIVVDDNSPDGTGEALESLKTKYQNLKVIHRSGKLGLSSAVLEGFAVANGEVLGVMDADLSHPHEKMGEMLSRITNGADLVIGSRYVKGGAIVGWGFYRKILSKGAIILARVFTNVQDPMSGFFFIKRGLLENKFINPKGFKLLLEILIKTDCKNIIEIPIVFTDRKVGESKAGMREIIFYLENLYSYLPYRKHVVHEFLKFSLVGLSGTILNIIILYVLTEKFEIYYIFSAIFAFFVSATSNFILHKTWIFKENIGTRLVEKYIKFFGVSLLALSVNIFFLYVFTEFLNIYYIISQLLATAFSLMINFIGNKIWTFQKINIE